MTSQRHVYSSPVFDPCAACVLQALQIEDLERLASLPLAEAKYQQLSNVTLLEMLSEIFNYGATQVGVRHVL
jgi:hypothetical protein